ncbi:MAG: hypothetical protein GQ574_14710 [Crocinitomix sp.]|nr:hypothetical protein [Crocinitomix sp.]
MDFEHVQELLDKRIAVICADVEATEPPLLFFTNSENLNKKLNKARKFLNEEELPYMHNFRYEVAVTKPYKGTRKNPKPFHFHNILAYLMHEYEWVVMENGLEADDAMCVYQNGRDDTIICSRDKDLRICEGNHYSWECGKQRSVGPHYTDRLGSLTTGNNGKTLGYGLKFFYYQMLVGDTADNIPGLKGWGDVGSKKLLQDLTSEKDLLKAVKTAYKEKGMSKEYFIEQANLLHMVQELHEGGKPKFWEMPND